MTKNKRFIKLLDTLHTIGDKATGNPLSIMGAVDLLNKYDNDCRMYRDDALKAENDKEHLLKENEQLKKELSELKEKHKKREWERFVNGGH